MSRTAWIAYGANALIFTVLAALVVWANVRWLGLHYGAADVVYISGLSYLLGMRRAHMNRAA